jgi:hypothetical protein
MSNLIVLSATHHGFGLVACLITEKPKGIYIKQLINGKCSMSGMKEALESSLNKGFQGEPVSMILDMPDNARAELLVAIRELQGSKISRSEPKPLSPSELLFGLSNALNENMLRCEQLEALSRVEFELQNEDETENKITSDLVRSLALAVAEMDKPRIDWSGIRSGGRRSTLDLTGYHLL